MTPRTDKIIREQFRDHEGWVKHPLADFARELERENAKLREALTDIRTLSMAEYNYQSRMGSIAYRALKT